MDLRPLPASGGRVGADGFGLGVSGCLLLGPDMQLSTSLVASASDFGSPQGVTEQAGWNHLLWNISFWIALPIVVLVVGLIGFAVIRYRHRAGEDREPAQFQYHIPLEATYTIIPLIIVAVIFGFMFNAENQAGAMSPTPAVKLKVQGFQWGWRFVYPNGHTQVGTANYNDINDDNGLPVLVMPAGVPVQIQVVSLDVVHTFYVKEFLFNRDLIPGIDNKFDFTVKTPGVYAGQCNNICGQYHAYMRFYVDVRSQADYAAWYADQPACSITTAGVSGGPLPGKCDSDIKNLNAGS